MNETTTITTLPPGPKGWPIVGNALQFQHDPLGFMRETERAYGRMATIHIGKIPFVLCFRPEHVRFFLTEQQRNFTKINRQGVGNLSFLLGDGLLTSEGDFHRQQRRLVQPAFHRSRIENYAEMMVLLTEAMLGDWQAGQEVNIAHEMQQLTLRIIMNALFSVDSREQAALLGTAFNQVINNGGRAMARRRRLRIDLPFTRYHKIYEAKHTLDTFVYDLIARRRSEGRDTGDVLSMLLEAQDEGNAMTDKQVHDQVLTFVAAGHETAQNTLSFTFYLLAQHPDVREKLLAELRSVLHGRAPTVQDLPNLPYLEWVINEAWRVYPPAWTQGRMAIEAFDLDGYHLPVGTIALFSQWVLHHLPDIWGDPDTFRPERWDPATAEKLPQFAYFPFGGGPRICIGMPFAQMETKLLLATILQRYTPRLKPGFALELQPRVTIRPKHGMPMILDATPVLAPVG
jgi:cytochrome P450